MRRMRVLTSAQMRRIDHASGTHFNVPTDQLMDNAGRAVAEALIRLYPALQNMSPIIVCGKGNNGGDGVAAARHLKQRGVQARVERITDEADWSRVREDLLRHHLLVDALLGTGTIGAARGAMARVIQEINESGIEVVSVDIPSGLSGDTAEILGPAIRAQHTIALECPKVPHVLPPACGLTGHLHVVSIGIPPQALDAETTDLNLIDESDVAPMLPVREADSHKGDYGRVLVVGGSRGKSGAAALVSLAALRSGAGLVTAATSASAQPILASQVMEMMTEALPEGPSGTLSEAAAEPLLDLIRSHDVLALGPGLTAQEATSALVRRILSESSSPVVLDADGLNAYAGRASELNGRDRVLILTPHPGEMARLLLQPRSAPLDRVPMARSFAREHACYLVLKGHRTLVAESSGQVWVNPTGNPGMATAGTGDVLTGVLASLLAQGLSPLEACLLGVYAHGMAGDLAAADRGEASLMARDVIEYLPEAYLSLERSSE